MRSSNSYTTSYTTTTTTTATITTTYTTYTTITTTTHTTAYTTTTTTISYQTSLLQPAIPSIVPRYYHILLCCHANKLHILHYYCITYYCSTSTHTYGYYSWAFGGQTDDLKTPKQTAD